MTELEIELRALIIEVLNLEDLTEDEIGVEDDLFSDDGIALDSIDALELGVAVQKKYGVKLEPKDEKLQKYFQNIRLLAELIEMRR
ncbi:phosphopantetheine-binding protein [Hirschia baltica]|uniref:Phosphopantetheine-binding n=1 Tax=Hirschia baltica (strain ATCC 49814 / DSM 5838 / IFAM 1418) TaxID=582402 RepID=C6XIQ7_HIRBI|nr:phosphopantetheine-binding protein [Hirschia baltica]ACT59002.1 phosphopantetheine-binding [Hirschia baltica ATCC 49814]